MPGDGTHADANPAVTVAIINYNGRELLGDLLASLDAQDAPIAELLFVDDGSTDDSIAFIKEHAPHARIVELGTNTGVPNLVRNRAIAECRTRYLLTVDNDVTLAPDTVRRLMEAMTTIPDAVMCMPRVLYSDRPDVISQEGTAVHFVCFSEQQDRDKRIAEAARTPARRVGCGEQLMDLDRIRPYGFNNEALPFGWADIELPWRMNLAGLGAYAIPNALAYNHRVRSEPRYRGQVQNHWVLLLEMYAFRTLLLSAPALLVFEVALLGYVCSKGAVRDYGRAAVYVGGHLPHILERRRVVQAMRRRPDRELLSAGDLLIPLSVDAGGALRAAVAVLNASLRAYWSLIRRFV